MTTSNLFSGVDDFAGSLINSQIGQTAIALYQQKTAADAARDQAKAQAEVEKQRAAAAVAAAKSSAAPSGSPGGGGLDPKFILFGVAGAVGLGVIIWAATRKG